MLRNATMMDTALRTDRLMWTVGALWHYGDGCAVIRHGTLCRFQDPDHAHTILTVAVGFLVLRNALDEVSALYGKRLNHFNVGDYHVPVPDGYCFAI